VLEFTDEFGNTDLPDIFSVNYQLMQFQAGYSQDVSFAGEYTLRFKLYYSHNSHDFELSNPFTVTVVDVCATSEVVITQPEDSQHVYVIGTGAYTIVMPQYTVTPSYCTYEPAILTCGQLCQYVTIVDLTVTVQIDVCGDLCTINIDGDSHTVVIIVSIGSVEVYVNVVVIVQNPCLSEDYFHVMEVPVPSQDCTLLQNCVWSHTDFEIATSLGTSVHQICGYLQYSVDDISAFGNDLVYDANTHTFFLHVDD
jgi:hypothetical protein